MLDKILRAAILISAGVTVVSRYAAFRMAETLGEQTVNFLNSLSYAAIAVLIVSGIIFAIIVKKNEKRNGGAETGDDGGNEDADEKDDR